jgi:hypothetical protein
MLVKRRKRASQLRFSQASAIQDLPLPFCERQIRCEERLYVMSVLLFAGLVSGLIESATSVTLMQLNTLGQRLVLQQ